MLDTTGMKHPQTAWAIERPDKVMVTSMIRATRREAIDAYRDHLKDYKVGDAWALAYRRGFRAVKVIELVTQSNDKSASQSVFSLY